MRTLSLSALAAAALLAASVLSPGSHIGFADPFHRGSAVEQPRGGRSLALHFWDSLVNSRDGGKLERAWRELEDVDDKPGVQAAQGHHVAGCTRSPLTISFFPSRARQRAWLGRLVPRRHCATWPDHGPGSDTVIIKTKVPNPMLPLEIASIYVVSKHIGEQAKPKTTTAARPPSAPALQVRLLHAGDRTLMERNPKYHGTQLPGTRSTSVSSITGPRTAALLSGDVDVIDKVAVTDVAKLKKTPR